MTSIITRFFKHIGRSNRPIPGYLTQYPDSNESSGKLQLVIGFDFGTEYTKVVIGERRRAYAVPFPGFVRKGGNPYLLPGILAVGNGQRMQLGEQAGARSVMGLKMRILNRDTGDETITLTASFMALVLQHVRAWFLNAHSQTYRNYKLDWYINVGLPTEHYHDDDLAMFYRQVVSAAWLASIQEMPLDLDTVASCLADNSRSIGEHAIGLFPEFVAQINGYVRSPLRKPDLHLLVDVGAGTVDVAVFNVHKRDGEDVFPIFAKSVEHRGVQFLHRHRVEGVNVASNYKYSFKENVSDKEVASLLGLSIAELRAIDNPFIEGIFNQIWRDIKVTKGRYPLSRHWDDGLPFFLCGGGANVELYTDLAERMERDKAPCRLIRMHLPKPDRLVAEGITENSYDRLSVAYGLSFDQLDIGEIVRSDEIDDSNPSRDSAICPRCRGSGGWMANSCEACGGRGWLS